MKYKWSCIHKIYIYTCIYIVSSTVVHIQLKSNMHMSKECADQVQIWSWFNEFWQSYAPSTLKNRNVLVSLIVSPKVVHIELKFNIWISYRNTQVKFKFGHGLVDFWVIPLELWKKLELFFLFIICPTCVHVHLKFAFRYITFEFGPGSIIFNEVISLERWKKIRFPHAILILRKCLLKVEITCAGIYPENTSHVSIWFWFNDFWQSYPSLNLAKNEKFSGSVLTFVGMYVWSNDIACAGILPENTSQVRIWSWSDVVWQFSTLDFKKI
jgi:hypothetical protein